MLKEDVIPAGYNIISILSTLFLFFILYILLYKTPNQMKIYRWLLVNIQISAYVECMYWALLMAPISEVYPIPHIYCTGQLYTLLGTSGKILFSIETFLHSILTGSLALSIGYRYRQLCTFETHRIYRFLVKDAGRGDSINFYIIQPILFTYSTYIGLLTNEETRGLILKLDPGHAFPAAVATFSDQAYIWALGLIVSSVVGVFFFSFLVYDSDRILRTKAQSSRTAALHKEAIIALITQMGLMEGVSIITAVIMGILQFTSRGGQTFDRNGFWDILLAMTVCLHSMKSVNCSLAILLVHKPYRLVVKKMFWKEETEVIMVSNASTDRIT